MVRVSAQVCFVSHFVPRTVAVLWRPRVRKRPFTELNSWRLGRLRFALPPAAPAFTLHERLKSPPPASFISVRPLLFLLFDWRIVNWPCEKVPDCVAPAPFVANESPTVPCVASMVEPI